MSSTAPSSTRCRLPWSVDIQPWTSLMKSIPMMNSAVSWSLIISPTISKFVYIKMPNVECSKRRQDAFKETVKSINPEADVMILEPKQINSTLITAINKGYLGIFAFNDELAYQVLKSLNKQVPNVRKVYPHLHIVGFDCVSTRIPGFIDITSVDFDYDAIVQESFEMIEDKFEHPEREKKSVRFPVTLHTRKYF